MRSHETPTAAATTASKKKGAKVPHRIEITFGDNGGFEIEERFRYADGDEWDGPPPERNMYSDAAGMLDRIKEVTKKDS
jgi:hypothetical protein